MEEIWKDIPGYEGYYQASSLGRVKSLKRVIKIGNSHRLVKEKIKTPTIGHLYYHTTLYKKGVGKTFNIHQLIAITFLNHKPCGSKRVVNHINFNKLDNRVENLEIVTTRQNSNQKHLQSSSNYVGVCYNKKDNVFTAYITHNKKIIHLGTFKNEKEASKYYEEAVKSIENNTEIKTKNPNYTSKYKGVSWNKKAKKWCAFITINGKKKHLGVRVYEYEAYKLTLKI